VNLDMEFDPGCYESHLTLLDDPAGQRIAECMSEGWATRAAVLLSAFEAQANGAWCALAASVIALRTINYAAEGLILVPTQRELHDEYVHANGLQGGVSLSELDAILRLVSVVRCASALQVEFHPGHDQQQTLSSLYSDLLLAEQDGSVLLVNFLRQLRGVWTGHWSVLGGLAVDARTGARHVLVLDVAVHKIGCHWVPLEMIVACICTVNHRKESRGYLRLFLGVAASQLGAGSAH